MSVGFTETVGKRLIGCEVEIFQGDQHDTIIGYADVQRNRKSVLHGKLLEVEKECLVLECRKGDDVNVVFVNSWTVHAIMEIKSGISIFDIYYPDERKLNK